MDMKPIYKLWSEKQQRKAAIHALQLVRKSSLDIVQDELDYQFGVDRACCYFSSDGSRFILKVGPLTQMIEVRDYV